MSLRGGRYEILGTIATGGMATVHLGRALGAGGFERLVAVKTMHPHLAAEEEFVAMFLDEARLAARIRHPNVVATIDVQQDEQGLFLVMEYVEGPSLSRLIRALQKKDARIPMDVTLRIFLDSLAGLHAAHELVGPDGEPLQLIHRDVSPHNILVGTDGIAKITDFGVVRATSRLATTRTGAAKGKINYMPPEQARSLGIDRRADIYSAGVVLWEMLTRERMVRGDSEMELLEQIMKAERRPPHEVFPEVPVEISTECMRAIERDKELRFPTAAAFAEAVEKAAQACGITPAPARKVAAFVREQKVHIAASDVPPSGSYPELGRPAMMSLLSSGAPPAPEAKRESVSGAAVEPLATPHPESIPAVGATLATIAVPGANQAKRGSSRRLPAMGAAALVVACGAALWFFFARGGSGEAPGPAAGAPAHAGVSTVSPSASVPPPSTAGVEPTSTASAPASASATAPASASPGATAKTGPGSGSAGSYAGPTSGAKTFRPKEL